MKSVAKNSDKHILYLTVQLNEMNCSICFIYVPWPIAVYDEGDILLHT